MCQKCMTGSKIQWLWWANTKCFSLSRVTEMCEHCMLGSQLQRLWCSYAACCAQKQLLRCSNTSWRALSHTVSAVPTLHVGLWVTVSMMRQHCKLGSPPSDFDVPTLYSDLFVTGTVMYQHCMLGFKLLYLWCAYTTWFALRYSYRDVQTLYDGLSVTVTVICPECMLGST